MWGQVFNDDSSINTDELSAMKPEKNPNDLELQLKEKDLEDDFDKGESTPPREGKESTQTPDSGSNQGARDTAMGTFPRPTSQGSSKNDRPASAYLQEVEGLSM